MSRDKEKVKTVSIIGREAEFEGTLKNEGAFASREGFKEKFKLKER